MHSPRCAGEFSSCSLLYRPPPRKYLGGGVGRRCCLVDLTAADGVATAVHGDAGAKVIDVEIAEPPAAVDDLPVAAEAEIVAVVNVDLVAVVVAVVITVVIAVVVAVEVVLVVPTVAVVVLSVTVVVLDYVELVGVEGKVPALDGQGGVEVKDAQSGLGAAGVGGRVEAHGRDRVVAGAVDANRLTHVAGVAVLIGLLASFEGRRDLEVADVVEAVNQSAVNIVAVVVVAVVVVAVVVVVVLVLAVMVRRRVTLMVRE